MGKNWKKLLPYGDVVSIADFIDVTPDLMSRFPAKPYLPI
jgi:hypothetical protein